MPFRSGFPSEVRGARYARPCPSAGRSESHTTPHATTTPAAATSPTAVRLNQSGISISDFRSGNCRLSIYCRIFNFQINRQLPDRQLPDSAAAFFLDVLDDDRRLVVALEREALRRLIDADPRRQ